MNLIRRRTKVKALLRSQHGMSLIEILIVISLMAIIGTIAATKVLDSMQEGYRGTARTQIANLKGMMQEYYRYCNHYPTTEQGLDALAAKPTSAPDCPNYPANGIISDGKVPKDPWGNPYDYQSPDGGKSFVITSFGRDG
ncbi:MAG: type II secretion system protein GspG, partial [Bdellovibrionota bacterium]